MPFERPDCPCFKADATVAGTNINVGDYKSNIIAGNAYSEFRDSCNDFNVCPPAVSFMAIETIANILRSVSFLECGYRGDEENPDQEKISARFKELVAILPAALLACDEKLVAVIESQQQAHRQ